MNRTRWPIVWLIFRREVRDQARDRRTLFMIFVLPMLLYPLLVLGVVQFRASLEQKPRMAMVVGAESLPAEPSLLNPDRNGFDAGLFDRLDDAERMAVRAEPASGPFGNKEARAGAVRSGLADAVVVIPPDVVERLSRAEAAAIPIEYDSADEPSQITYLRLREVLDRWKARIVRKRLVEDRKPVAYTEPIQLKPSDVAAPGQAGGSVWARLFPFLLVIMALNGAFYPSVDLCAGEKERGTMETLLITPATRGEIVLGKFFTVMLASILTALLNLMAMGLTGMKLAQQVGAMGPPPGVSGARAAGAATALTPPSLQGAFWMVILLVPLAIFFSALCVALAVLARSMKEGQYYMTPLYLVCLPLSLVPAMPGIELNLFYSLMPIAGVSLLLRALMLSQYDVALRYAAPVLIPTLIYGALALRWAVDQFNREDVLFREAERFDLRGFVRHLLRDKEPTPRPGEALLCFFLMISATWFVLTSSTRMTSQWFLTVANQVGVIFLIPTAMAALLTSDVRRTLRLTWPRPRDLALGAGLAVALNPLIHEFGRLVEWLFPLSAEVKQALAGLSLQLNNVGVAVLVLAVLPAVCEEVAFRGYILSGLRTGYGRRAAVLLSSLLFGVLHALLSLPQQLFNASILGVLLALLALRSGSLLPGIVFHLINNGAAIVVPSLAETEAGRQSLSWLFHDPQRMLYHWQWTVAGALAAVALLVVLVRGEPRSKADPYALTGVDPIPTT